MTTVFRAKAPLRLSFAGGGTDVPPFPQQEGGLVLSATINRYAHGILRPRQDRQISVESVDFSMSLNYSVDDTMTFDGKLDLVKAAIRKFTNCSSTGYDLLLRSSAPPGSGLGSSSALTVALIGVLMESERLPLVDYEVASLAYDLERVDLGIKGGLQDQYASTFGGFNFIEFHGDRVIVNPLRVRADSLNELEQNLLLCYTGTTRLSDRIIEDQTQRFHDGNEGTVSGLQRQKELAVEMKDALLRGRLSEFGGLLAEAWHYKKKMSTRISNPLIDEAYDVAVKNGALGGKVTGAGGGGYMLFYCDSFKRHRVASALSEMGVIATDFAFEPHGLVTWVGEC
jgi:D-glycero-alpha-D-manno-heptose-7-phosphate kinase